jgi:hypothetical protein
MTDDREPTLAELFNIPVEGRWTFRGKSYPARQPTQVEEGLFELWLEQEASAWVERQTHLPPDALQAHRAGVRDDAFAGKFDFLGELAIRRRNTLDGAAKMTSILLLADGHGECDPAFCRAMLLAEAEAVAKEIITRAEAGDPKARAALKLFRAVMKLRPGGPAASSGTTSGGSSTTSG